MTKRQQKRKAFLTSITAMILSIAMLVGTTFSWFTDSTSNTGNRIEAGTLKIDLLMDKAETGEYESISNGEGDIFSEANGNGVRWEPGKTEIVYLQVQNKGDLAAKYNIELTIKDGGLAGALEYAILDGAKAEDIKNSGVTKWSAVQQYEGVQISDMPTGDVVAAPNGKLIEQGDSDYFALAVHMKEEADNSYSGKEIAIDVTVLATQVPEEEDSFGNQYDANAMFDGVKDLGEGMTTNLLVNGDFEYLNSNGNPTNWSTYQNRGKWGTNWIIDKSDPYSGTNCLKMSASNASWQIDCQSSFSVNVDEAMTIPLTAKVKIPSTNDEGFYAYFDIHKTYTDGSVSRSQIFLKDVVSEYDEWVQVSQDVKISPSVTQILVRITAREMMPKEPGAPSSYTNDGVWSGEMYVDDISFIGPMSKAQAASTAFKTMLAEEAAVSMKVEQTHGDIYEKSEPFPGQTNLVVNGGFDNGFDSWDRSRSTAAQTCVTIVDDPDDSTNKVAKYDVTTANTNPFMDQSIAIVGGAEYQVSFRYRYGNIGTGKKPNVTVKTEFYFDTDLPGASTAAQGETYLYPKTEVRTGEWQEVCVKVYPSRTANKMTVMPRVLDKGYSDFEIYFDDIEVVMTQAPVAMDLDTGNVFYYNDQDKATFKAEALLTYYPELIDAVVDFQVYDGTTLLWEKRAQAENGVASVDFSFSELMKEEHPYCVKAIMYHKDGTEVCAQTQNIYVYPRPEYLGSDGIFMKNGEEPFVPMMGYHWFLRHYEKAIEAGLNLAQMGTFNTVTETLNYLDKAEEQGIMGFICLYYNMKPAGHDDNIDKVCKILSDERVVNHPALFGYAIMDEAYLHSANPEEELENSYRLIRMFDTKHPIMVMEAVDVYYHKCQQFVDILMIDPYSSAEKQFATDRTEKAIMAVNSEKPVYSLLEAYYTEQGRYPTANDLRNNNYQALIAGASSIGYFSISDSWYNEETSKRDTPVWEADDNSELWNAMVEFGTKEWEIAADHFILDNSPKFNEGVNETYRYYSWVKDGEIYMVVLGLKEDQTDVSVSIPLTSGDVTIGSYTSEIVAGSSAQAPAGNGQLDITINGVEAILYRIIPDNEVDFSSMN